MSVFPLAAGAEQASQPTAAAAGQLDAGAYHTCTLLSGGRVRCWGFSGDGQLGYGNTNTIGDDETPDKAGPVNLGEGRSATAIGAGDFHTCALLDDGSVRCWGLGLDGRLGYGNRDTIGDDETPDKAGPVKLGGRATAISAGGGHSCALLGDGSVRCWGFGGDGALGYASTDNVGGRPTETPDTAGPVSLGRRATAISAGRLHTCALLDDGSVRCWGDNRRGQLGFDNTNKIGDDETPDSAYALNAVACPSVAQCTAVDAVGREVTFNPTAPGTPTPTTIDPGATPYTGTVNALACPSVSQCTAVDAVGRQVTFNPTAPGTPTRTTIDDGQPLSGVACPSVNQCTAVGYSGSEVTFNPTAPGTPTATTIDSGGFPSGVACPSASQCTAVDLSGQQVTFNPTAPGTPTPTTIDNGQALRGVACPSVAQCTAVDDGGGREVTFNPIAPGTPTPVTIDAGTYPDNILNRVACPSVSRCTAVDYTGRQVTFNPAAPGTPTPTTIDSGQYLSGVACPSTSRCTAVDQVGRQVTFNPAAPGTPTPTTIDRILPVNLGPGRAVAITAGDFHTCALLDDGSVHCWGRGASGELGYGNTFNVGDTPARTPDKAGPVSLGGRATAISAGGGYTCALLEDGSVRCWGYNANGQLGYGNTNTIGDDETPDKAGPVNLGRRAVAISAGGGRTCARLDDGSVRCWGSGANGLLGYCNQNSVGDDELPSSMGPVSLEPGTGGAACALPASATGPGAAPATNAPRPKAPTADSDAVRARGLRLCLGNLASHAKREQRLARRGSARQRAKAKLHLNAHARSGRRHCLRVYGRTPGPITGLRARRRGRTQIELSFKAAGTDANHPRPAKSYVVKQSRRPIRSARAFARAQALCKGACRFTVTAVGGNVSLTVTDLRPHTTYYYAVAARDNVSSRRGPRSQTVKIKTG